jgi:outer membrane protease
MSECLFEMLENEVCTNIESKSLSAWLREAGTLALRVKQDKGSLNTAATRKKFFQESNQREKGSELDWEDQKKLILEGYRNNRPS